MRKSLQITSLTPIHGLLPRHSDFIGVFEEVSQKSGHLVSLQSCWHLLIDLVFILLLSFCPSPHLAYMRSQLSQPASFDLGLHSRFLSFLHSSCPAQVEFPISHMLSNSLSIFSSVILVHLVVTLSLNFLINLHWFPDIRISFLYRNNLFLSLILTSFRSVNYISVDKAYDISVIPTLNQPFQPQPVRFFCDHGLTYFSNIAFPFL